MNASIYTCESADWKRRHVAEHISNTSHRYHMNTEKIYTYLVKSTGWLESTVWRYIVPTFLFSVVATTCRRHVDSVLHLLVLAEHLQSCFLVFCSSLLCQTTVFPWILFPDVASRFLGSAAWRFDMRKHGISLPHCRAHAYAVWVRISKTWIVCLAIIAA